MRSNCLLDLHPSSMEGVQLMKRIGRSGSGEGKDDVQHVQDEVHSSSSLSLSSSSGSSSEESVVESDHPSSAVRPVNPHDPPGVSQDVDSSMKRRHWRMDSPECTSSQVWGTGAISADADVASMDHAEEARQKSVPQHQNQLDLCVDFEIALISQRNKRVLLSRLEATAPRGRLSMINLSRRGLGVEDAALLKEAIVTNPQLSVLKLGYNSLGNEGASVVAAALLQDCHHHQHLSVLDMGFNGIGDTGCESIAVHCLAGNFALHTLYLSGNQIGEKGSLAVAGAILHGTGLSTLHFSANRIGSMGMKAIAGAIAKNDERVAAVASLVATIQCPRTMEELYLGSTSTDSEGFIAIPGMLLSNSSLRSICLSDNSIEDRDMLLLSQALSQNKTVPLETIQLSFNQITCQGVECLMNSVWGSKTLRELRLDNNRIQDRGAQLCAVVLTSIPLEILDLSFNRVTTIGIKALMKNISENSSLLSLGLCGISIDQNASKAVSFALAYNTSLKALYLDNCSAGYSAQRHIVAGIVSNRRACLRSLTGFPLGPIAMTLGIPMLPEEWSNDQVLGFVRLMWQQWELKAGRGNSSEGDAPRGPAPPAAVATAAKIALTSLGTSPQRYFLKEAHEKPISERSPVDPASAALLERTDSGTMHVPAFRDTSDLKICELTDVKCPHMSDCSSPCQTPVAGPLRNPERRNHNLKWLRVHFRALSDVGRLPFNNADLWQLHQFYFSPPFYPAEDGTVADDKKSGEGASPIRDGDDPSPGLEDSADCLARPPALVAPRVSPIGRTVSFQALGTAFAASSFFSASGSKRRSEENVQQDNGPAAKRAKNLKPRIAYYPRLMSKIQSLGTRPMEQTLSLLRQLKYTENSLFAGRNPYAEFSCDVAGDQSHSDIEMILLDLL